MRRLSDYTGEEAIDLWADIFDPVATIISDKDVKKYTTGGVINVTKASKVIAKKYKKEIFAILSRLDDDAISGANYFPKLILFVTELTMGDSAQSFFKSAEPEKSAKESSGSVTGNTEDGGK